MLLIDHTLFFNYTNDRLVCHKAPPLTGGFPSVVILCIFTKKPIDY